MLTNRKWISSEFDSNSIKMRMSGTVTSGNSAAKTILAYYRVTGELLGVTVADISTGDWLLDVPYCPDESITLICRDEGGDFNADIYDRISLCNVNFDHPAEYDSLIFPDAGLIYVTGVLQFDAKIVSFMYIVAEHNLKDNIETIEWLYVPYEGKLTDSSSEEVIGRDDIQPGLIVNGAHVIYELGSVFLDGDLTKFVPSFLGIGGNDQYTKLLIQSNTVDESIMFKDNSDSTHVIAVTGDVHHEIDQHKFRTTSIYFGGTGDYLSVQDHVDLDLSSGSWSIDFWIHPTDTGNMGFIGKSEGGGSMAGWYLSRPSGGGINVYSDNVVVLTGITAVPVDTWTHIAVVYDGTDLKLYFNGIIDVTETSVTINTHSNPVTVGRLGPGYTSSDMEGYLDEIRISTGIVRWSEDFTPPTISYPSIPEFNVFDDFSATYFTGSNNDLTVTSILAGWCTAQCTTSNSDAFYFEVVVGTVGNANNIIGVLSAYQLDTHYVGVNDTSWGYFGVNGTHMHSASQVTYGITWGAGDRIGVLFMDGALYFWVEGDGWQGSDDAGSPVGKAAAFSGITGPLWPGVSSHAAGTEFTGVFLANFVTNTTVPDGVQIGLIPSVPPILTPLDVETIYAHNLTDTMFTLEGIEVAPVNFYSLRGHWRDDIRNFDGVVLGTSIQPDHIAFDGTGAIHELDTCADTSPAGVGDESDIDILCKFKPTDVSKETPQIIYKSGDDTNGVAVALDGSGAIGLFGNANSIITSITVPSSNVQNDTWYNLKCSNTGITLFDNTFVELVSETGTVTSGNGTGQQTVGGVCAGSPVTTTAGAGEYFEGNVANIQIADGGTGGIVFPVGLKIACEIGETGQQCYVEVEKYDIENAQIELWVKIPTLSNTEDTVLRFYFSNTHADNTSYVGLIGSTVAQNVWDSNFIAVYHMVDESGIIIDSTANELHLSLTGGTTVAGMIGNAVDFNGSSDVASVTDASFEITATGLTYEAVIKRAAQTSSLGTITTKGQAGANLGAFMGIPANSDEIQFGTATDYISGGNITTDVLTTIAGVYNGTDTAAGLTLYASGIALSVTETGTFAGFGSSGEPFTIGAQSDDSVVGAFLDGTLDEVRISDIERTADWELLTNKSNTDTLITYSSWAGSTTLKGWDDYVGVVATIDYTDIPTEQTDFPVRISISETSGSTDTDLQYITTELRKSGVLTGTNLITYQFGSDRNGLERFTTDNLIFSANHTLRLTSAMTFTGSGDQVISLPEELRSTLAEDEMSICFWMKCTSLSEIHAIFGTTHTYEITINITTDKKVHIWCGNSSSSQSIQTTTNVVLLDEWMHIVHTRNWTDLTWSIYINGVLSITAAMNVYGPTAGSAPIELGANSQASNFIGSLSDFYIFDTDLSADDIAFIYKNTVLPTYTDIFTVNLFNSVHTTFPLFLDESITAIDITLDDKNETIGLAFTIDHDTYYVYESAAWRAVASTDDAIHGDTGDSDWHYRDGVDVWQKSLNSANFALSAAFEYVINYNTKTQVDALTVTEFDTLFDSTVGVFDVAVGIKTSTDFVLPEFTKIRYNNSDSWSSEVYDLEPYDGIIVFSQVNWSYTSILGDSHIKVYVMKTGDTSWIECTNGLAVPGITAAMDTIGIEIQFKMVLDLDIQANPDDVFFEFILN